MGSTGDKVSGKAKEIAGKATNDDELKAEGKAQHTKGEVKDKMDDARASIKGAAEGITGKDDN